MTTPIAASTVNQNSVVMMPGRASVVPAMKPRARRSRVPLTCDCGRPSVRTFAMTSSLRPRPRVLAIATRRFIAGIIFFEGRPLACHTARPSFTYGDEWLCALPPRHHASRDTVVDRRATGRGTAGGRGLRNRRRRRRTRAHRARGPGGRGDGRRGGARPSTPRRGASDAGPPHPPAVTPKAPGPDPTEAARALRLAGGYAR